MGRSTKAPFVSVECSPSPNVFRYLYSQRHSALSAMACAVRGGCTVVHTHRNALHVTNVSTSSVNGAGLSDLRAGREVERRYWIALN